MDRPVAVFFQHHQHFRLFFQICATPSLLTLPVAGLYLTYAVYMRLRGRVPLGKILLIPSVATLAGTSAKDELKWIFGRPWPGTWLKYGSYQFHPLTFGAYYGSFPSGHTAYISAPLCALWVLAPRWRPLWGGVIGIVMAGLVAANYHFVGDVLAGLLTGMACAWGSLVLMRTPDA